MKRNNTLKSCVGWFSTKGRESYGNTKNKIDNADYAQIEFQLNCMKT